MNKLPKIHLVDSAWVAGWIDESLRYGHYRTSDGHEVDLVIEHLDGALSPLDAARRLRDAAVDGRLEVLAEMHGLALVVLFGSASRGQPDARDLDVAVGSRGRAGLDVLTVICAFMDLVDSDQVDLLDLDRAGPVARQHALVPGDPLYEYPPGEFARQQMASGQRLGTEWMRRLDLALMADRHDATPSRPVDCPGQAVGHARAA